MTMSKNFKNVFWARQKTAGCPDSKTKASNISWNIPDPIRTNFYLKIAISTWISMNILDC